MGVFIFGSSGNGQSSGLGTEIATAPHQFLGGHCLPFVRAEPSLHYVRYRTPKGREKKQRTLPYEQFWRHQPGVEEPYETVQ